MQTSTNKNKYMILEDMYLSIDVCLLNIAFNLQQKKVFFGLIELKKGIEETKQEHFNFPEVKLTVASLLTLFALT